MASEVETTSENESAVATLEQPDTHSKCRPETKDAASKPRMLPPYHVLLLDDEDHTHEYVIEMMRALFGYSEQKGYEIAQEVNLRKKAIVFTTHKELAELKRDQIHSFGTDIRVATCVGSMSACIVAAE